MTLSQNAGMVGKLASFAGSAPLVGPFSFVSVLGSEEITLVSLVSGFVAS